MDLVELSKQLGIDLSKIADDLEPVEGSFEFKMFTRTIEGEGAVLKAWIEKDTETGEDEMFISGVASSTIKDLHGDTILPSALIDMERQANANMTIFLNHSYQAPEDVAGSVVKATIQSSANDAETGAPIYDLAFEKIRVEKTNERAVKTFQALQPKGKHPGTKLGLSIGGQIPEGGAIRNKKDGTLLISHINLLETSIVSIPANPRSWIEAAVKSLRSGPTPTRSSLAEPLTLEAAAVSSNGPIEVPLTAVVSVEMAADTSSTAPIQGQGKCPTCGKGKSATGCSDPYHKKDLEPDTTASTAPSQGAPQSEPGADGSPAAPTPVAAAATPPPDAPKSDQLVTPDAALALGEALTGISDVTLKLIESNAALVKAEQRATKAESERDVAVAMARDVIRDAAQIIDRIGKLPIGQRASFKAIRRDFDGGLDEGLDLIYSPAFMAELRSKHDTSE